MKFKNIEWFVKARQRVLLLFVYILCFAAYNPFGKNSAFTLTNVLGSVYILTAILTFKSKINIADFKKYIIPLVLLFLLITIMNIINETTENIERSALNFKLLRNYILFSLFYYDLKDNISLQRKVINTYLFSIISIAILAIFNIGVSFSYTGRLLIFETNTNLIGLWTIFGISIIINNVFFEKKSNYKKYYLLLFIPILLTLLAKTGSRGAIVLLIVSILSFTFFSNKNLVEKTFLFFTAILAVTIAIIFLLQNEILADRIINTLNNRDLGERSIIWNLTFNIIKENPVFGCGETGYEIIITDSLGKFMGTHNAFLYITVSSGIIGLVFFLTFLVRIYKSVIYKYKLNNQVLPIVLYIIILLHMMKAGGVLIDRTIWFLLAYIISTTTVDNLTIGEHAVDNVKLK